jgi:hypothetical protein
MTDQPVQESDHLAAIVQDYQKEDQTAVSPRHKPPPSSSEMEDASTAAFKVDAESQEDGGRRSMSIPELGGEERCPTQIQGLSIEVCRVIDPE